MPVDLSALKGDDPREERAVSGCLLIAGANKEVEYPQKAVITCGLLFCKARSDHVGELPCKRMIDERNKTLGDS